MAEYACYVTDVTEHPWEELFGEAQFVEADSPGEAFLKKWGVSPEQATSENLTAPDGDSGNFDVYGVEDNDQKVLSVAASTGVATIRRWLFSVCEKDYFVREYE